MRGERVKFSLNVRNHTGWKDPVTSRYDSITTNLKCRKGLGTVEAKWDENDKYTYHYTPPAWSTIEEMLFRLHSEGMQYAQLKDAHSFTITLTFRTDWDKAEEWDKK